MEIWQTINTLINGAIIGVLVFDWALRRRLDVDLRDARTELSKSVAQLNVLHNEVSNKLLELQEKVAAHEYQLTAKVSPKNPNPFGGMKK